MKIWTESIAYNDTFEEVTYHVEFQGLKKEFSLLVPRDIQFDALSFYDGFVAPILRIIFMDLKKKQLEEGNENLD